MHLLKDWMISKGEYMCLVQDVITRGRVDERVIVRYGMIRRAGGEMEICFFLFFFYSFPIPCYLPVSGSSVHLLNPFLPCAYLSISLIVFRFCLPNSLLSRLHVSVLPRLLKLLRIYKYSRWVISPTLEWNGNQEVQKLKEWHYWYVEQCEVGNGTETV
jgi:hypothetical protein